MQIFKTYAESYPEVLDQRVVDLCLVGKHWNAVANSTPQLWTKINLSSPFPHIFPFPDHQFAAVLKRVRASRLQKIDVSIDFRDPDWDGSETDYHDEDPYIPGEHAWVIGIMVMLEGTEGRWRSIKVVSNTWVPLYEFMHDWRRFTHLPSLESISMQRDDSRLGLQGVSFSPRQLMEKKTLFGQNALLPKLRDVSLYAVHVDWNVCQNLRKLEITNQTHDVGPSFEEFATMLSSSPRLECLSVYGFCPEHHTVPALPAGGIPQLPVVHLPVLKEFVFGWKDVNLGCTFLRMFQIGDSLETLALLDTESGFDYQPDPQTGGRGWKQESQEIFEVLCELGSAVPRDKDDTPSGPFISVRRLKRLRIYWTKAARSSLVPFLATCTELEGFSSEDIDENMTEDVMVWFSLRDRHRPGLVELSFWWRWYEEGPAFVASLFSRLKSEGDVMLTRGAEQWIFGRDSPWDG